MPKWQLKTTKVQYRQGLPGSSQDQAELTNKVQNICTIKASELSGVYKFELVRYMCILHYSYTSTRSTIVTLPHALLFLYFHTLYNSDTSTRSTILTLQHAPLLRHFHTLYYSDTSTRSTIKTFPQTLLF